MSAFIDLTGRAFGRLTVVRRAPNKGNNAAWVCECECGEKKEINGHNLRAGLTKSCGCFQRDRVIEIKTTHGMRDYPEYTIWYDMRRRCNPKQKNHHRYAGRGISVCDRWNDFENFYSDMGARPSLKHTIDRVDNDGNYEPGNCRWATRTQQNQNQGIRKTNTSGVTGVHLLKNDKWQSYIGVNGRKKFLYEGYSFQLAVEARKAAERKYWI